MKQNFLLPLEISWNYKPFLHHNDTIQQRISMLSSCEKALWGKVLIFFLKQHEEDLFLDQNAILF